MSDPDYRMSDVAPLYGCLIVVFCGLAFLVAGITAGTMLVHFLGG